MQELLQSRCWFCSLWCWRVMLHIRKGLYPGKAPRAFRLQLSTFLIRVWLSQVSWTKQLHTVRPWLRRILSWWLSFLWCWYCSARYLPGSWGFPPPRSTATAWWWYSPTWDLWGFLWYAAFTVKRQWYLWHSILWAITFWSIPTAYSLPWEMPRQLTDRSRNCHGKRYLT